MFDTMKVAKKIKEARIAQNMTQMNLADAMEVSYQAVSNWERGNSMPDISKLEQLCTVLHISLEELLGTDTSAKTVSKIIQQEESTDETVASKSIDISLEEAADILPLLPPVQVKKIVEENTQEEEEENIDISALVGIAPYLDDEYLDELVKRVHVNSLSEFIPLAPYLSEETLNTLVQNAPVTDMSGIVALAPYLEEDTLDLFIDKILAAGNISPEIEALYPFLADDTLHKLADYFMKHGKLKGIQNIAPFL